MGHEPLIVISQIQQYLDLDQPYIGHGPQTQSHSEAVIEPLDQASTDDSRMK
jgi:hypothetical protein